MKQKKIKLTKQEYAELVVKPLLITFAINPLSGRVVAASKPNVPPQVAEKVSILLRTIADNIDDALQEAKQDVDST